MRTLNTIVNQTRTVIERRSNFFLIAFLLAAAVTIARAFVPFTSPFDEHTHLSYVQYVFNWVIPAEGFPMNTWAKEVFSCYPHAIFGRMTDVPCGVIAAGSEYPTGGTNTSQVWPPVYFIIVAIFMRIPMLLGIDPLMSARLITAVLWSLGAAWLGLIAWKKSNRLGLSIGVVVLLASLPTFYFYTSFVSPHSLDPLILAGSLAIADRIFSVANRDFVSGVQQNRLRALRSGTQNIWLYVLILFSAVVALAVPQALAVVGIVVVYLITTMIASGWVSRPKWLITYSAIVTMTAAVSLALFYVAFEYWQWQKDFRAKPVAAEVDPGGANSDPAELVYGSRIEQVISLWGNFWPSSLTPGLPSGPDVTAVVAPWALILTSLSVAAIIFWKKGNWLGPAMIALFLNAPLFAVLYDVLFTTAVPVRYGLLFALLGILAFANNTIPKWPERLLLTSAAATYFSAFFLNNLFVQARFCGLDELTKLIVCPAGSG